MRANRNFVAYGLGAFVLAVGVSLPAWAELEKPAANAELEDLLLTELPQVITASKVAESSKLSPATIFVITSQQIKDRGYQDLKDILLDLPGVDITPNIGGESGGWQVIPRGLLGNNKIQVLLDGLPLNPPSGDRFVWGNNISLDEIDHIEVLFGPASALYGADAMGGIINMISKKGVDVKGGQAKAVYGTANSRGGSLLYGQKFPDDVDVVAFGRIFNSDGFDFKKLFPEIYGALDTRFQTNTDPALRVFQAPIADYNAFAKLTYKDFTLTLARNHYHENNTRGESVDQYVMNQDAFWAFDTDLVAFKYSLPLSETVALLSTLSYNRYQTDTSSNYPHWYGDAFKYVESKRTKLEEQLNADILKELKCVFGVELSETANQPYSYNFDSTTRLDPNLVQWVPNPTYGYVNPAGQTVPFHGSGLISERQFGVYAQARYFALDNLSFVLGDRYDWNSYYDFNVFNPRAGVVYQPTEQSTVKLLYGNAFISPSLWANNIFWMGPTYGHVTPDILGIKLKPERLESYEVNTEYDFTPKLTGTLDVYYNKTKDLIQGQAFYGTLPIIDLQGQAATIRGIETAINLGEQTIIGADLTGKYQFLPGWEATGSYSYIRGTVDNPLDMNHTSVDTYKVATHKGLVGIAGKFLDHFGLFVRERIVGTIVTKHTNEFAGTDVGGNNRLDGYLVTDLNLRIFDYLPGLALNVNVINLFDKKYYGDGMEDERYKTAGNWIPRVPFDPRTILAGLEYKF